MVDGIIYLDMVQIFAFTKLEENEVQIFRQEKYRLVIAVLSVLCYMICVLVLATCGMPQCLAPEITAFSVPKSTTVTLLQTYCDLLHVHRVQGPH